MAINSQKNKIKYLTAKQAVLNDIRHDIITGILPSGSRLLLSEIANKLGISITPVREAMSVLASEGLVKIEPHRGTIVYAPNLKDLHQIYDLRIMVETYVTRLSIPVIRNEVLEKAQNLLDLMTKDCDYTEWIRMNGQLHDLLTQSSVAILVSKVLHMLRNYSTLYVALSLDNSAERRGASNIEHSEIINAYRNKNIENAVEIMVKHLESTRKIAEEALILSLNDKSKEYG